MNQSKLNVFIMKIVKYVIQHNEIPLLFCPRKLHSEASTIGISAGFAIINYDSAQDRFIVKCYGGSESLRLVSNKRDFIIIQDYLNCLLGK